MDKYKSRGTLRCEFYEEGNNLKYRAHFVPDTDHHAKHDKEEFAVFVSSDGNCAIGRKLINECVLIEVEDKWKAAIDGCLWDKALVEVLVESQSGNSIFRLAGIKVPAK